MDAVATPPMPEVLNALSEATVAGLAGTMLVNIASFLEATASGNSSAQETPRNNARVCRIVAKAVAQAPFGNAATVLSPTDLGGKFHTEGAQVWSNAAVAAFLLEDTARMISFAGIEDLGQRQDLQESAEAIRQLALLLHLAPGGQTGPRLNELLPYLRHVRSHGEDTQLPDLPVGTIERAMAQPEFAAICEEAFRVMNGRDLESVNPRTRRFWTRRIIGPWLRRMAARSSLDQGQVEQMRYAVGRPRQEWCMPPLVRGEWSVLDADDALAVLCLISSRYRAGAASAPFGTAWFCDRVRSRQLDCFGGSAILAEVQGQAGGGTPGIVSFVLTDDDIWQVNGASDWLHELNNHTGPHLAEAAARLDYMRVFLNCVRNGGLRFQPLESADDLDAVAMDEAARRLCAEHARTIVSDGIDHEGRWLYRAVVLYDRGLFHATFAMSSDGLMEMTEEQLIEHGLNIRLETMSGPFVVLSGAKT